MKWLFFLIYGMIFVGSIESTTKTNIVKPAKGFVAKFEYEYQYTDEEFEKIVDSVKKENQIWTE